MLLNDGDNSKRERNYHMKEIKFEKPIEGDGFTIPKEKETRNLKMDKEEKRNLTDENKELV